MGHLSWHRALKSSDSTQPEASIRPWRPGPLPWGWRGWHPSGCCSCLAHPCPSSWGPSELSLLPWLSGSEGHSPSDPRKGAKARLPQSPGRYPRIRVCSNHSSLLLLWASLLGPWLSLFTLPWKVTGSNLAVAAGVCLGPGVDPTHQGHFCEDRARGCPGHGLLTAVGR